MLHFLTFIFQEQKVIWQLVQKKYMNEKMKDPWMNHSFIKMQFEKEDVLFMHTIDVYIRRWKLRNSLLLFIFASKSSKSEINFVILWVGIPHLQQLHFILFKIFWWTISTL